MDTHDIDILEEEITSCLLMSIKVSRFLDECKQFMGIVVKNLPFGIDNILT